MARFLSLCYRSWTWSEESRACNTVPPLTITYLKLFDRSIPIFKHIIIVSKIQMRWSDILSCLLRFNPCCISLSHIMFRVVKMSSWLVLIAYIISMSNNHIVASLDYTIPYFTWLSPWHITLFALKFLISSLECWLVVSKSEMGFP